MNLEEFTVNRIEDGSETFLEIFSTTRKATVFVTSCLKIYDAAWAGVERYNDHGNYSLLIDTFNALTGLSEDFGTISEESL